ncbi:MAG TPA: 3-isopropylmalate dehydratase small subunit [Candidatus Angelobacter sp.]|nr:3-isopropylmalate dehydratase small subunit [Candidatus Angelobacter sp.]
MQSFTVHTGIAALLDRDNVDTDQIIPKQFLKRTERTGYGECLFFDWRFDREGKPDPAFPLNEPQYKGASILIAGKNFGCGSSREHAVWALRDYGFRAVIAPSFADIFSSNCVKNGVLTVVLRPSEIATLKKRDAAGRFQLTVDLQKREVSARDGFSAGFEIDAFRRTSLLDGLDEIGMTLRHEAEISAYEKRAHKARAAS